MPAAGGVKLDKKLSGTETGDRYYVGNMEYNELGQLVKKKLHDKLKNGNFLQDVDFTYNIRGWLTKINDPANLGNDLFAMQLAYNDVVNELAETANAQFNGNISAMVWKNNDEFDTDTTHGYAFVYDAINRIIQGNHEYYTNTWTPSTNDYDLQSVSYDANGNIKLLSRYGNKDKHIDNLDYEYAETNQLQYVSDIATNKAEGFTDGTNTGNDYAYDNNGNLTHDNNKGIVNIKYNYLNLPEEVDFGSGNKIVYIYTAGGVKQARIISGTETGNRYYIGNMEYNEAMELEYIHTDEGRVRLSGSELHYDYYLKDHLGNTRVVFSENATTPGLAEVLQIDNYYPFGMRFNQAPVIQKEENNYLYNGKELQENYGLAWADYGARMYDAAICRWQVIDNKAEKYYFTTPYTYALNNPIIFVDPDGQEVKVAITDAAQVEALSNFMATKEGMNFIAKFASAGQTIMGYKFDKDGEYAQKGHDLTIRTVSGKKMGNALGNATTYLKNGRNGSKRLRDISAKDLPANQANQYESFINLRAGESIETNTYVMGHEAFVHTENDFKQLMKFENDASSGKYNSINDFVEDVQDTDLDAGQEHGDLKKDMIESLVKYVQELDVKEGESYYEKLYEKDKSKY